MEMLNNAKKLASKYGISFYKFDPFLSFVNNKLGFCTKLKTKDFGYLTRNFVFNNLDEFEQFLKKYSYYKNFLEFKSEIKFDNYLNVSPKIIYDFEEDKLLEKENEEIERKLIVYNAKKFIAYISEIYENRLNEIIKHNSLKIELDAKLNEYKKNLHAYYHKPYTEASNMLNNIFQKYQEKVNDKSRFVESLLEKLEGSEDLAQAKLIMRELLSTIKKIEEDDEYYSLIFDTYLFKNKIAVIDKMNEFVIQMLNSENKISYSELKLELDKLKESIPFNNTKSEFIEDCVLEVAEKYKGIENIEEYNYFNYLNKLKLDRVERKQKVNKLEVNNISVLNDQFNELNNNEKKCLYILFSPFKKIIEYIIEQAINNTLEKADFNEYYEFYLEMVEIIDKVDNTILSKKYFDKIDFSSYQNFVSSLIDVAEIIYGIRMQIKNEETRWACDSKEFLVCYKEAIKNDNTSKVCLKENSFVLYSDKVIKFKNNDRLLLEVVPNTEIIIFRNINNLEKCDTVLKVADYKYSTKKVEDNIIVDNISCAKTYVYNTYNCYPKE